MGRTKKSQENGINNHLTTVARQLLNDIYMFWNGKSAMSMRFLCFGIAKLECKKLNIFGYFFSISFMPMHDLLKKKNMHKKKSKKIKNALNMIASVYSRRCGSYRTYLEGDSPHQTVMIVCELK